LLPNLADIGQTFASDIESGLGTASQIGQKSFFDAFSEASVLGNRLQQISTLAGLLTTATGPALDQVRNALKSAFDTDNTKSGNLPAAAQALRSFGDQPWESLASQSPEPTPTTTPDMSNSDTSQPTSLSSTGATSGSMSASKDTTTSSAAMSTTSSMPATSSTVSSENCLTITGGNARRGEPTSTNACALTSTSSTSSSSTSAIPTPTRFPYFITTNTGTDGKLFSDFVKTLPDNGTGEYVDRFYYQNYSTDLNETEADAVAAQPFVYFVDKIEAPSVTDGLEEFEVPPKSPRSIPDLHRRLDLSHPSSVNLNVRIPSADHLRLISQADGADPRLPYAFDSTLGQGSTVYIIDTGINLDHAVSSSCFSNFRFTTNGAKEFNEAKRGSPKNIAYVVPNRYTMPNIDPDLWAFDGLTGDRSWPRTQDFSGLTLADIDAQGVPHYPGHGTGVASVAVGATQGVASKAELVFVKYVNAMKITNTASRFSGLYRQSGSTFRGLEDALAFVINDVRVRNREGKAVINFSHGRISTSLNVLCHN
jgi:hypothetical protein